MSHDTGTQHFTPMFEGGWPAPPGYPSRAAWPDDDLPPGSLHTPQEWQAARTPGDGFEYHVFEVIAKDTALLVSHPKPKRVTRTVTAAGGIQVVCEAVYPPGFQAHSSDTASMAPILDGACLVAVDSKPAFARAAHGAVLSSGQVKMRVINPRRKYMLGAEGAMYLDAKINISERDLAEDQELQREEVSPKMGGY